MENIWTYCIYNYICLYMFLYKKFFSKIELLRKISVLKKIKEYLILTTDINSPSPSAI